MGTHTRDTKQTCATLRFVLGDQLSRGISSLRDLDPQRDVVLLVEVAAETTYVRHHKKKIAFILSAMRHFAEALRRAGVRTDYVTLDDPENTGSFAGELARAVHRWRPGRVVVTEPGEWRVEQDMLSWERRLGIPVNIRPDDRFLASRMDFANWAAGRRGLRMEFFYREMRQRHRLLLEGDGEPAGGRWNFDKENRKPLSGTLLLPEPRWVEPDRITREVLALVAARFGEHFGDLDPFRFAVTPEDAEAAFEQFVATALPTFGDFQDAMHTDAPWLYHAVIGLYLNVGLLDPGAVCRRVEVAWRDGDVPLNCAEGFIRQILGWREYVRGVYWLKMPGYAETNALDAQRPLPWLYWSGETDMRCMAQAIGQTKREAYAHHIQRLMITGNFALLAGLTPAEVCEWYLIVYADAFEWVELPNTHGMALFADGGVLGSKPYAASGAYINRMSDYCAGCRFDPRRHDGPDACPFNYLYWDFLARNGERLGHNPRLAMPYRNLARFDAAKRRQITRDSARFLDSL